MTFDDSQDAFRHDGTATNAQAYLDATLEYWEDAMIGEATFDAATNELATWCNDTESVLIDRRFGGEWNSSTVPATP